MGRHRCPKRIPLICAAVPLKPVMRESGPVVWPSASRSAAPVSTCGSSSGARRVVSAPRRWVGGALRNHLASTEASTPESAPNSN